MKWEEFIRLVAYMPVVDTEFLLAGISNSKPVKVQISRWLKAGKLIQIKRGIYLLDSPYRKIDVYEPYVASLLKKPSYLSLEKALEFHNLIPEGVMTYTSVTTKRQGRFISKVGAFDYKHIKNSLFWGYKPVTVNGQTAFIASPEKALLDFFYMRGVKKISQSYLDEMRLQNLDKININRLVDFAKKFKKPGMAKVARLIKEYTQSYNKRERVL